MTGKPAAGSARSVLDLAWSRAKRRRPGPRPTLELDVIVAAAVAIADADGIDALSMHRLASGLGITPMALYRYVRSKDDLVFLAIDAAAGSPPARWRRRGEGWRSAIERWATVQLDRLERHRWVARVPMSSPPIGPNQVAWMERGLEALAGTGLEPRDRLGIINLVAGFVLGHFRLYSELARGASELGTSREEAERDYATTIGTLIDPSDFPHVAAAFAGLTEQAADHPRADFEFGLARILDGVELMVERSQS